MNKSRIPLTLVASLWVTACGKPPEDAHTVSWYLEHPDDMQSKSAWCSDDSGRQDMTDCKNALQAKVKAQVGSQKDLAPLDWNSTGAKKN
jgi:hypothetical protein